MMRVLFFLFILIILHSCTEGNKKTSVEKNKVLQPPKTQKDISIKKIGELRFRMGYVIEERESTVIGKVDSILRLEDGTLECCADPRGDDAASGF